MLLIVRCRPEGSADTELFRILFQYGDEARQTAKR